jgi:hypothetical protein
MNTASLSILVDGILGLAVIAGGIVLAAIGKFDQSTAIAVIAAGVAVARGASTAALALKVPTPTQPVAPPTPEA